MSLADRLFNKPDEFILCWAGDDCALPKYGGEIVVVPPKDEIAVADKGPYRYGSAVGPDGRPLPGTVLLRSRTESGNDGGTVVVFDAEDWCKGLMSVNKPLFDRGLDIVREAKEVVAAQAEGRKKWKKARKAEWLQTVRDELERQSYWKTKGIPAPESSDAEMVREALAGLKTMEQEEHARISEADLLAALSPGGAAPAAKPIPVAVPAPMVEADADLEAAARALYEKAKALNVSLTHKQKDGLWERDLTVMAEVEAKLSEVETAKTETPVGA